MFKAIYHWTKSVATNFAALSKPQARVLALFSFGIARARSCTLEQVAQRLFWRGKIDSVERWLQRYLSNEHIDWKVGCQNLSAWVLNSLVFGNSTLALLVDETALQDHLKVMAVSLAYRGRAIPLAWWCYHQERYPMRQVQLIDTLLGWVAPHIPKGYQVLVQADRGLGTSPALLRCIERRDWHFLVRVQGTVRLLLEDGRKVTFRSVISHPGQQWSAQVKAFAKSGWRTCWALAYWGKGYKEPWLLVTDSPAVKAQQYGWRMWEELAFRDFKSYGWHWERSHVWDPDHANLLWLAMALAYVWTLSLGTQAAHWAEVRQQVSRGRRSRYSLFRLGLRVLHALQNLKQIRSFFDLFLIPNQQFA